MLQNDLATLNASAPKFRSTNYPHNTVQKISTETGIAPDSIVHPSPSRPWPTTNPDEFHKADEA
jgi:hypothetical protein